MCGYRLPQEDGPEMETSLPLATVSMPFPFRCWGETGFRDYWDMTGCAGGNLQGTPKPSKTRLCLQTKVSARLLFGNMSIEILKTPAAVPPDIPKNT